MKNVEEFIEEFTTNFAELFVETFFVRYLSNYPVEDLNKYFKLAENILNKKIESKINNKLKKIDVK